MLGAEVSDICTGNDVLRRHLAGVIGAELVKQIKKDTRQNCYWIANTESTRSKTGGKHWYLIIKTSEGTFEVFDPLGTKYTFNPPYLPQNTIKCTFNIPGITAEAVRKRMGKIDASCEFNVGRVQGESENCALFCLLFALRRFQRWDEDWEEVFDDTFTADLEKNEKRVEAFYRGLKR